MFEKPSAYCPRKIIDLSSCTRRNIHMDIKKLEVRLKEIPGGKVLDVATGSGQFIQLLMEALNDYHDFVGIDVHEKALEYAQKQFEGKPVHFQKMDAENLSFKDNTFDTVGIQYSLHHMKELDKVLSEMFRVLKPGGHFLIGEMYGGGDQTEAQHSHIKIHHLAADLNTAKGDFHDHTCTRDAIRKIVEKLSFSKLEEFDLTYPVADPKNPEFITKMKTSIIKALDRYKEIPEFENYTGKVDELIDWIETHGYAPASSLFFIGEK